MDTQLCILLMNVILILSLLLAAIVINRFLPIQIEWIRVSEDQYNAYYKGWFLMVEQMDEENWFWKIEKEHILIADWVTDEFATTKEQAFEYARKNLELVT